MPLENPHIVSIAIDHIMSEHGYENGNIKKSHWFGNLTDDNVQDYIFEVFAKAKGYLTEANVGNEDGVLLWDDASKDVGYGNDGKSTATVRMYVYVRNMSGECDVRTAFPY